MANNILTIDMITAKALQILENNLVITRNVNKQYDPSFAVEGAKIGTTLRIRLPDRALVTDGAALGVQEENQQYTTLTVSTQQHVAISFTSAEQTMQLDHYADLVLKPRVSQLASTVDAAVASASYKKIWNSVGTPGTTPSTSLVLLQAMQKLNENAAGMNPRYGVVNPAANAQLVEGMKGLFNPVGLVANQYKTGLITESMLGYDEFAMSQSIPNHVTGDWGTTITSTGTLSTQGQATLPISFTGSSKTWKEGDVFTISGVYAVNPQTRQSTGSLQQFVVTADTSGSSTATLSIAPAIYTSANALATVDSFPQAGATVTMLGSPDSSYAQNLVYHRDAITFATADLLMPGGVMMGKRDNHNGISIRIVQQYDINNDRMPCRLDVLYGSNVIRPEMACRVWGA